MLEEALKVFGLNNVCSLKDLDIIYKKMVRKNYEENFPYNKEIGLMNVRIYEWSYQIILPFAIGKELNILNSSYNYTGLAVVSSPRYGKIYVQMFIGK